MASLLSDGDRARVDAMGEDGKWLMDKATARIAELEGLVETLRADLDAEKSNSGSRPSPQRTTATLDPDGPVRARREPA